MASNVGGIPEIIKDRANGTFIPLGSTNELVNSAITLLEDTG